MKRLQKCAILLSLVEKLKENKSWCGETHIQKSTYFLQHLLNVPLEYDFLLYKYGPYSFDLLDELTAMRADCMLSLTPNPPFGPSFQPAETSELILDLYPKTTQKYQKEIDFVATQIGKKNVSDLERLATSLYVTIKLNATEVLSRAKEIHKIKPHVKLEEAQSAVCEFDNIKNTAKKFLPS